MRRTLSGCVLVLTLVAAQAAGQQGQRESPGGEADPVEPVEYILSALREHPVVCLTEGGHQAKQPHVFLRRILGDEAILRVADPQDGAFQTKPMADDRPAQGLGFKLRDVGYAKGAPVDRH